MKKYKWMDEGIPHSLESSMDQIGFELLKFASPTTKPLNPVFEYLRSTSVAQHRPKHVIVSRERKSIALCTIPPSVGLRARVSREGYSRDLRPRWKSAPSRSNFLKGRWYFGFWRWKQRWQTTQSDQPLSKTISSSMTAISNSVSASSAIQLAMVTEQLLGCRTPTVHALVLGEALKVSTVSSKSDTSKSGSTRSCHENDDYPGRHELHFAEQGFIEGAL
ncbi:hypothetical protein [Caballeronia sordidicola]|uniref:Uncharacterized protein n=1 Tax=Caballeronia sordidicola TaxID=196367 RepID=A0A226WUZ8_CABSO|nr:hypothetical protein [Caballeronia sordidicola]OXC74428.1 hypothetical protein BSU04_32040 [Caballeronia sordidicola]